MIFIDAGDAVAMVRMGVVKVLGRTEERALRTDVENARVIARTAMSAAKLLVVMLDVCGVGCCACSVVISKGKFLHHRSRGCALYLSVSLRG